jgi:hypothetical protein
MAARLNARTLAINPLGHLYPDDDTPKAVVLQADGHETATTGDRHVLLCWVSYSSEKDGIHATQILQLSGGPGNYSFQHPMVQNQPKNSIDVNKSYDLGSFTRAQRNRIVEIARGVDFNMKSRVNSCRTWTRMLFVAMIDEGLLAQETFDMIDEDVPLRKPLPEV